MQINEQSVLCCMYRGEMGLRNNESSWPSSNNASLLSLRTVVLVVFVVVSQALVLSWASSLSAQKAQEFDATTALALAVNQTECPPPPPPPPPVVEEKTTHAAQYAPDDSRVVDKQHYNPLSATGVDANATCEDLLNHFHYVNHVYMNGNDDERSSLVSPPLINYAFYGGQGFGRLVEHTAAHCMLSFSLDRPCLIDLSDRDPYYTWRAFINTGTYDWEFQKPQFQRNNLAKKVRTAIDQLEKQSFGKWEAPVPHTDDMHLMEGLAWSKKSRTERKKYWKLIEPWRAENIPKTLLSPNWGDAWFPKLMAPAYFGQCHRKELFSRIQNAMYQPTPLTMKLHRERQQLQLMMSPQRPYGSIHIRFVILEIEKFDTEEEAFLEPLYECLRHARNKTGLSEWWLVSDKPSKAVSIAQNVTALFQSRDKESGEKFKIFFAPESKEARSFTDHSNNKDARGMFGHASMSVSILDWMVLHESQAAIVTYGSYGNTGARGHGKYEEMITKAYAPCSSMFNLFV